jgi:pseudoazurin
MRIFTTTMAVLFLTVTASVAENFNIDMLNKRDDGQKMVYSEDVLHIKSGDIVTWLPTSKGHNVEFVAGPDSADLPKKPSKVNKEYTHTFTQSGIYLYQCSPHKSMGMIALIVVDDDTTNIETIKSTRVFGKSKKKLEELTTSL